MTTPFPFVASTVLTAAQMNAITTLPIATKTASYTAVVGDVGKRIVMNVASANTVTINNSIFAEGDTIFISNKGAGSTTVTAGAGVTINTSGSLTLATSAGGTLVALSASTFGFFSGGAATLSVDYLVIAGGGGGGKKGGGGGAGGYRNSVSLESSGANSTAETPFSVISNTSYLVTVGAGGAGSTSTSARGSTGSNSVFDHILSYGGGGGGSDDGGLLRNGTVGGSGSGAAGGGGGTFLGGSGIPLQGLDGAANTPSGDFPGGGGGGAGAAGSTNGNGGNGLSSSITGSAVTRGGGGAGGKDSGSAATGGSGGGGTGGVGGTIGTAGTANLGGGGGAGGNSSNGSAGGSGVVILRYADTSTITIGAGLTGTESAASGGYKRATITAGTGNVSWA